jgi:hypothetical protein
MKDLYMARTLLLLTAALLLGYPAAPTRAGYPNTTFHQQIHADRGARWFNANMSWHGPYSHVQWGHPVALIVPPTATMQTEYSWGVARTQMIPIRHQFDRPIAVITGAGTLPPSPRWPSRTQHLGVYSVRGPW